MADRLKGITVEIGGDTTGLNRALQDVNKESRSIQGELSEVNKLLKFNPDNAELLAQRQTLLNRQIETTARKLNDLKQVERQVQAQFERGDIGEEQFRAFQREIIATEGRLQHFQHEADDSADKVKLSFKGMGAGIANGIAGAVAGAGISSIVSKALENSSLDTKIKLSFDVADDEAVQKIKGVISTIETYGVEGETALEGVRKQFALNAKLSDKQNQKLVEQAAVISQTYGDLDFTELIQESNELGNALGISQEEALAMTNQLLKTGFPPDQLDIITEYGSQLKRAGYNASEIQGIFAAGVETKSWNIDVLLDGVKEGRIKLAEFGQGIDKTTAGLIKGTSISAEKLQEWGTAVAEGGDAGKIAFGEVATELGKVKDDTQRNAIGVALFGTLWEEQGSKITQALSGASTKAGNFKKNQDEINKSVEAMKNDPQVKLNTAISDMNTKLAPVLTKIADLVAEIADWAAKNPGLTATITALAVAIGVITGAIIFLLPVMALLTAENYALAGSMALTALPILAIVAAIAAVIAIGILLYKNWGTIKEKAKKDFNDLLVIIKGVANRIVSQWKKAMSDFKKFFSSIGESLSKTGKKIKDAWNQGITDIKNVWHKIMSYLKGIDLKKIGSDIIHGLVKGMSNMYEKVKSKAKEIGDTVKQAIKDKLRMKSPSKVTEELGENVGLGMSKGIENSLSHVAATSNRLAVAATPTTNTVGSNISPVTNSKSMIVNINSPKALDIREANKQFTRTLNKMSLMW